MATLLIVSLIGALLYVVYQLRADRNWAQEQIDWVKTELLWEDEIGAGSFSTTFKVQCKRSRHHTAPETFAVKRMELASPVLRKRAEHLLLNELYVLSQKCQHQHIVEVVGVVLHDPTQPTSVSIIMEFMAHGTLRNLLDTSPQMVTANEDTQVRIAGNVASAMSHLHSLKVRHEDLRTSNVALIVLAGNVVKAKVTDVGMQQLRSLLNAAHEACIEAYMPPEGFEGRYVLSSDVYAYGVLLWELLTAERPWRDETEMSAVRSAICHGQRPPMSDAQRSTFLGLRAEQCWAQRPDARPTFDALCSLFLAQTAPLLEAQRTPNEPVPHENDPGGAEQISTHARSPALSRAIAANQKRSRLSRRRAEAQLQRSQTSERAAPTQESETASNAIQPPVRVHQTSRTAEKGERPIPYILKGLFRCTFGAVIVVSSFVSRRAMDLWLRIVAHPIFYLLFFALYASYVGAFVSQSGEPTTMFSTASTEIAYGARIGLITPGNATGGSPWLPDGKTCLPIPDHYHLRDDETQRRNIPIVYGLMHGSLLALTLMPLTMCHALWAKLVGGTVDCAGGTLCRWTTSSTCISS